MIQPNDFDDTWGLLEIQALQAGDLRVRELTNIDLKGAHPLLGVDSKNQRQVLVPVKSGTKIREDTNSGGVQIVSRELLDADSLRLYTVIICRKPHLNQLFSIIIAEILNALLSDTARPDLIAQKVLNHWRELLERLPDEKPDMQTIVGIFGELWQLLELIRINPLCVSCWQGPLGARHDIIGGGFALEVKTSLSSVGRFVTIHGHEQLEPIGKSELYLASIKLQQVQDDGLTLLDLIGNITKLGGDHVALQTLLARAGFTTYTLELCNDIRFVVKEHLIYLVDEFFPRIVAKSFSQGKLPDGVIKLDYTIDLTTAPQTPLIDNAVVTLYQDLASKVI